MNPSLSVVIAAHNPNASRLTRILGALAKQTLPTAEWELIIVDNGSKPPLNPKLVAGFTNARIVSEPKLGLTWARKLGFQEARGGVIVLVDDDNELDNNYLSVVNSLFAENERLGAAGGRVNPEFEIAAPAWIHEFLDLLACRDWGDDVRISKGAYDRRRLSSYPAHAPIGAGMALRTEAIGVWLSKDSSALPDRRGEELTSGGDNDIILALSAAGWDVGYFPDLRLTHLIASQRITTKYLARLNHGIQKSWMQVLYAHAINPWNQIARWTIAPRKIKAWLSQRAWRGRAEYVRWRGACGHFEGRVRR